LTYLELGIDAGHLIQHQSEGRVQDGLKSGLFDAQVVIPNWEQWNAEDAAIVCNRRIGGATLYGFGDDISSGNGSAALIRNGSGDGGGHLLSEGGIGRAK
jgi:hypothetical protein